MKKLFRNSKATIEPLPPPTNTELRSPAPTNVRKSFQNLMGGGGDQSDHHPQSKGGGWGFGGHSKQEVTPFPMELGRDASTPPPVPSKKKDKGPTGRPAPTLLELQQQQQPQWSQGAVPLPNGHDEWPRPISNGERDDYGTGYSPPPSGLYLPPGARPATPPATLRPSTPNQHHPYTHSQQHSQASLQSQSQQHHYEDHTRRDRGYSSASASNRESDHEGALPVPNMRSPAAFNSRSPLAHSYASEADHSFPAPHPYTHPPADELQHLRIEDDGPKEKKRFWGWGDKKGKEKEGEDRESVSTHSHDGRRAVADVNNVDQAIRECVFAIRLIQKSYARQSTRPSEPSTTRVIGSTNLKTPIL